MTGVGYTFIAVERQLRALGETEYDIGIGLEGGDLGKFFRKKVTLQSIQDLLPFLRAKNAEGHHLYIRPANRSGLVLLDDLSFGDDSKLSAAGLSPAAWLETSPDNFQAWVRVSTKAVDPKLLSAVARYLAKSFGADPNSADWRHYGRLAGFTNRKPKYAKNGVYPFVLIHQWSGVLAEAGLALLLKLQEHPELDPATETKPQKANVTAFKRSASGETYQRFANRILEINSHRPWASDPDWSRMDWMVGKDMMHAGFTEAAVCEAMLQGSPNLLERHAGPKRMDNYVRHTVKKIFSGEYD